MGWELILDDFLAEHNKGWWLICIQRSGVMTDGPQ